MPTYHVTAPDGRKLSIQGDTAPSESELDDIFKNMPPAAKQADDEGGSAPVQPQPAPSDHAAATRGGPEMGTTAAYAARALPAIGPAVQQSAQFVAKTPAAQKVIAHGIGAVAGEMLGGPVDALAGTVLTAPLAEGVGKVAGKIAGAIPSSSATRAFTMRQAIKGTTGLVGRDPVTGEFTKILPSALKSVIEKLGPAMGMMSGESAALEQLNDPAKVKAFIAKLSPEEKAKLFRQMPASFAKEYQD